MGCAGGSRQPGMGCRGLWVVGGLLEDVGRGGSQAAAVRIWASGARVWSAGCQACYTGGSLPGCTMDPPLQLGMRLPRPQPVACSLSGRRRRRLQARPLAWEAAAPSTAAAATVPAPAAAAGRSSHAQGAVTPAASGPEVAGPGAPDSPPATGGLRGAVGGVWGRVEAARDGPAFTRVFGLGGKHPPHLGTHMKATFSAACLQTPAWS